MLRTSANVLLLLLLPAVAANAAERKGFLIGFSLGGGTLDFLGDSGGAAALDFYLGGSVAEKATLGVDLFVIGRNESSATLNSVQMALILQYWVAPRLWIGGGPGFGQDGIRVADMDHWGPTKFVIVLEGGVEVWQRGQFALDIRGRYGRTFTEPRATSHAVASVGFTWY